MILVNDVLGSSTALVGVLSGIFMVGVGGDKTEQTLRERRHFFHVDDQISLSLEYQPTPPTFVNSHLHPHLVKPLKASNGQQEKQQKGSGEEETDGGSRGKEVVKKEGDNDDKDVKVRQFV